MQGIDLPLNSCKQVCVLAGNVIRPHERGGASPNSSLRSTEFMKLCIMVQHCNCEVNSKFFISFCHDIFLLSLRYLNYINELRLVFNFKRSRR
nr:MAG TPA: hypothetical protein [Caudoviricetes sp.]DAM77692.1 MAG TPA: hypothetical protein [Caudoviricetes sp.]